MCKQNIPCEVQALLFAHILQGLKSFHQFQIETVTFGSCCLLAGWEGTFARNTRGLDRQNVHSYWEHKWVHILVVFPEKSINIIVWNIQNAHSSHPRIPQDPMYDQLALGHHLDSGAACAQPLSDLQVTGVLLVWPSRYQWAQWVWWLRISLCQRCQRWQTLMRSSG